MESGTCPGEPNAKNINALSQRSTRVENKGGEGLRQVSRICHQVLLRVVVRVSIDLERRSPRVVNRRTLKRQLTRTTPTYP